MALKEAESMILKSAPARQVDAQAMRTFNQNLTSAYESTSGPMRMGANIPYNQQTGKSYFDGFNPSQKGLMDTIYPWWWEEREWPRRAVITEWFYNPLKGQPRYIDVNQLRLLAKSEWVKVMTQVLRREIESTPWDIVPKDSALKDDPPSDVQSEIEYVKFFLNDCNPNHESIETIISMACQDLLELDAGAFVKGFTQDSYITTSAGGLELAPRGQRQLVELWARDGGSFLAETDVNGVKYRWWQYCTTVDGGVIETNPSIKTVDEIREGERVLGKDGRYHTVQATARRTYEGLLYEVRCVGVPPIKCTPEHPFLVRKSNGDEWVQAKDLQKGMHVISQPSLRINKSPLPVSLYDERDKEWAWVKLYEQAVEIARTENVRSRIISKRLGIHRDVVAGWLRGSHKPKYIGIPHFIEITSQFTELAGYFIAEGSITNHQLAFTLHVKEQELADRIQFLMRDIFSIDAIITRQGNTQHVVYSRKAVTKFFHRFYASRSHKAWAKQIPQELMLLPPEAQVPLLKAYWQGDGYVHKTGLSAITVSEKLAWQLRTLLMRNGIYPSLNTRKPTHNRIQGREVKRHTEYTLNVKGIFGQELAKLFGIVLHQKRIRVNPVIRGNSGEFLVPITAIATSLFAGDVYSLQVEDVNSYSVNGIMTHNSYLHPAVAPIEFDINEISYFMQYPAPYSVYGWSPLQSLDNVLSSLINSAAWNTNFFSEATMPSGLIGVPGLNPEELERFRQYFRTEIKGRWHRIAVVNQDVKYVPFALTNRDMQWLDGQQWYIKIVAMLYNVTPTELGLTDDIRATGKAMGAQEDVFKRKSIMPILRKLEQVINNTIVSELAQKVMFQYKPTDRSEELMQIDVDNKDIESGKKKMNEVRKTRGLGEPVWYGEEPLSLIIERVKRGEPIPPLQLPHPDQAPHAGQQTPELQRDVGKVNVETKAVDPYEEAFNNVQQRHDAENATETGQSKAWPPVLHDQTGTAHTQDDTSPHTQNDSAHENRPYKGTSVDSHSKEISGNRIGWGKEQREDYVGQQSETIPGASERGQLPTAIGRKPGESDNRAVGINPTDVGGSAGAYPIKSDRIQHDAKKPVPSVMGTRSVKVPTEEPRFYPGAANNATRLGTDSTEKPYDDTIDIRNERNRPKDDETAGTRIIPGDPLEHYGQHPWENNSGEGASIFHGHRTGVDQSQNPAYRVGNPPDSAKSLDSQASIGHVTTDEQAVDTSRRETPLTGTKQVQPPNSDEAGVTQFPTSHIQREDDEEREKKDYVATPSTPTSITDSQLQNQPTHPAKYRQPEHDQGNPQLDSPLNAGNPPMEAGPPSSLDEYQLDRLRHGPAGPAATTPKGAWRYPGPEEGSAGRELIEGEAQDSVMTTRKAKPTPGATGYLREPTSDTPMHQDLPQYYGDQNPLHQFGEDNLRPSQLPTDLTSWYKEKGLDLSNKLRDQIQRFGKFTAETKKEFGALVIRKAGEILLDQVQVGEDHAINIEPTRPLEPDEEILGSYHQHPQSNEFSPWDMTSFLNSEWEKCMILNAADGSIIVAIKTPQTKPLEQKPEDVREQYQGWSNPQFAKSFNFLLFHGSVDDLEEVS